MKIVDNPFTSIARLLFRAAFCLVALFLFFLLARGACNLIFSFSIPLGFSATAVLFFNTVLIALFICFSILLIIHFFRTSENN